MSLWSRIVNVILPDRLNREIDEELASHLEEAIRQGRDPEEARRAFGSTLRQREESRDIKLAAWLDSLRADAVLGWRQLRKNPVASAAAILSLALAVGACTAAFRLIDALLLRPLPVAEPERLYAVSFEGLNASGQPNSWDSCSYPMFRQWRAAVKNQAELIAISYAGRTHVTYGSDQDMEKAYVQNVSGWMFRIFGIQPAVGRLLRDEDDRKPGSQPYAVLSYDYWTRRFGRDPRVIGRTFHMGSNIYTVIGVVDGPFTGTETGTLTDIFVPVMMEAGSVNLANAFWLRTLVQPKPGVAIEPLRAKLDSLYRAFEQERAKGFVNFPKSMLAGYPKHTLLLKPAAAGVSAVQKDYRRALVALAALVALVLLIACANVGNLMTAQAAARAREMALRVSIGAGRWRLVQLVLAESSWLALAASTVGALLAWWAAPFVVSKINPPDHPARLLLPADWRVLGFGIVLALAVTLLFGLAPALRASSVKPASALRGGDNPHSQRRLMHGLIAMQVAFCFLVLFVAGLFVASFHRLSNLPTGFSTERLLVLDTVAKRAQPVYWTQVADHLSSIAGIEKVALAAWPLMSGTMKNNFISVNGAPPTETLAFFLGVSPNWLETMQIPLLNGRDLRAADVSPGTAVVNQTFARQFFQGSDPVGRSFETPAGPGKTTPIRYQIVGVAGDATYRSFREPMLPVVYVPLQPKDQAVILVRTSGDHPLALASILRQEVSRARSEFRVTNIQTQTEINQAHTVRERLLAMLALFFAMVALLLAGVGLYGVLEYSVLQRRREIGIRLAIGAQTADIARRVTAEVFAMVLAGAVAGLALGMVSARYIQSLLYEVRSTDLAMLVLPSLTVLAAAFLAALPSVMRAVRIDPVAMLRVE